MASFKVEDKAWELLFDEPPELYKFYNAIRRKMNFDTCIAGKDVGLKISEQYLRESISWTARPGRAASKKITRDKIKWCITCLERMEIVEHLGNFVFLCNLAVQEKSIQKINTQGTPIGTPIETPIGTPKKNVIKPSSELDYLNEEHPQVHAELNQGTPSRYTPPPVSGINNINNQTHHCDHSEEIKNDTNDELIKLSPLAAEFKNYFLEKNGWGLHMIMNARCVSVIGRWVDAGVTMQDVEECRDRAHETLHGQSPASMIYYDKVMQTIIAEKKNLTSANNQQKRGWQPKPALAPVPFIKKQTERTPEEIRADAIAAWRNHYQFAVENLRRSLKKGEHEKFMNMREEAIRELKKLGAHVR